MPPQVGAPLVWKQTVCWLEVKPLPLLQQPSWLLPTTSAIRYQLPFSLLLKDSSSLLSVFVSMVPVETCSELPWRERKSRDRQAEDWPGLVRSRSAEFYSLLGTLRNWSQTDQRHLALLLAWSQHCWAKGAALWRYLGYSMSWGQVPACGRGSTWSCRAPGIGADHSCSCIRWFSELCSQFCTSPCPVSFPWSTCTKGGERADIMESLTPVQLALGVKGPPTGILFVLLSLSGSLAEAGKQGLYKQSIKAIVFWAMNRSGEGCFLSSICCIVDTFRQNKWLHKS